MDLIERYVQETARQIPRKQREDVARELRSSLEDSLENRTGLPLNQIGEDLAVEMLVEFGPPKEVAASYRSDSEYLIGPALYPVFIKTLQICAAVVGGLIALSLLIEVVGSSGGVGDLGWIAAEAISNIQSGFLVLLGLVVLIFAIIERKTTPGDLPETDWDPHDLPPVVDDTSKADRTGTIVGLVVGTIALLLVNFAPDWLQIHVWSDGDHYSFPLLGSALRDEIPIFNAYLVLGLALGVVVLVQGRWHLWTRFADAAISALLVVFLVRLWTKADALLPGEADLLASGWPAGEANSFAEIADEVLSSLLWWVLLAGFLLAAWVCLRKLAVAVRSSISRRSIPIAIRRVAK